MRNRNWLVTLLVLVSIIMIPIITAIGTDEFVAEPKAGVVSVSSEAPAKETSQPLNIAQTPAGGRQGGEDINSAYPITSLPFTDQGTTIGYVDDYYEFCPYTGEGAPDVVYSYSPAVPETVTISLCDDYTDYDTKLFVYRDGPNLMACNDDACPEYRSRIDCFTMSPDSTYYFVVDGYAANEGNYQIDITYSDYCGPCELDCPSGSFTEAELCGNDANGGCNMTIPAFEPISNNQTVCGTIWADGGSRDTDWYELVLTSEYYVTWTAAAEFPLLMGFIDTSDCAYELGVDPSATGNRCDTISCSRVAGPGTYWLFVSTQVYDGYPCGTENDYWAALELHAAPTCGDVNLDGYTNNGDAMLFLNYMLDGGPPPLVPWTADVDLCGNINVSDLSYLYRNLYGGGPAPCEGTVDCDLDQFVSVYKTFVVFAQPGQIVQYPINVRWEGINELAAFTIGIQYDSDDIEIVSVELSGLLDGPFLFEYRVDNVSREILVYGQWLPGIYGIPSGYNGSLLNLNIRIAADAQPHEVHLDSIFIAPAGELIFTDEFSNTIRPSYFGLSKIIIQEPQYICGDADGSGDVDIDDVVYLIAYIFSGGPPPDPLLSGDANGSGDVDIDDVVYLIAYIFSGGPVPCGTGTVTDFDDNVYRTIKIGDQWWMMENLKVTHYRNGDPIPNVTDDGEWEGLTTGAYCEYDNDPANVETYGRLYNLYAVDDSRNIAPEGWHAPTDDEWKQLEMYLGMSQAEADGTGFRGTNEGGKLKEAGTTHWNPPNTGATNESGFTALPGGDRGSPGGFLYMGNYARFWCKSGSLLKWGRLLNQNGSEVYRAVYDKRSGFSVRCVRD